MSNIERKLVTIRTIDAINPIEGADAIECAVFGGWTVVVKKNEFKVGDRAVYFEIDSFLPTGNPAWQFLVDKSPRTFEGVVGHRLRTVKLRGQISQGFVMPLSALPQIANLDEDADIAAELGIKKWEQPLPAELAAISRAARKARENSHFPNRDDEDAVIRCATAHAWDLALPPILRWIHR